MNSQHLSGKELVSHIVSLGETRDESHLEELITFLSYPNGNVRRLACSALGKIRSSRAEIPLLGLLDDPKPQVRQYAIKALGHLAGSNAFSKLTEIANSPNEKDYNTRAAKLALRKISRRVGRWEKHQSSPETEVVVTASEIRDFDYCNLKWQFKRKYKQIKQENIGEKVYQKLLQRRQILNRGERLHEQHAARPAVVNHWGWIILLISLILLCLLFLGGF